MIRQFTEMKKEKLWVDCIEIVLRTFKNFPTLLKGRLGHNRRERSAPKKPASRNCQRYSWCRLLHQRLLNSKDFNLKNILRWRWQSWSMSWRFRFLNVLISSFSLSTHEFRFCFKVADFTSMSMDHRLFAASYQLRYVRILTAVTVQSTQSTQRLTFSLTGLNWSSKGPAEIGEKSANDKLKATWHQ